ncbi:Predicted thiol-disulfide oxidoreductase YuxK, DCC family [Arachidicoccus rhizosphaerae]|uniref:Predicted thiol-disulfide oxidoreductase YuxK, DCC family n=1 Tax=Arachidicoccus rhizosphaerae TaxID=551991 RepID=A0A1H3VLV0_9BACT|nr:DCC1-like thiol-disulfide oxidoreductase family protein [Arachidicoccus rhizosphaerae]SDZ75756.1 Predicted thiol-disulfide oxidoreductase YuxK, DCC family [Arachidicoccus rhizosphaerae]
MENSSTLIPTIDKKPVPDLLLLFDGVCNLCDRSVQFIIRHDPKAKFKFASLQSDYTRRLVQGALKEALTPIMQPECQKNAEASLRSIILIKNGQVFDRSTAVIKVLSLLGFPWNLATIILILPRALRDPLYNYIARHRYKWYGKKDRCMVPTPELKTRFMDS